MPHLRTRALTVVIAIVAAAVVLARAAQTPSRSADRVVPASPEMVLPDSMSPEMRIDLIKRLLISGNVRFGLESPPPAASESGGALAASSGRTLNGLAIGAALDAICRDVPLLRWSEVNAMIVVRTVADDRGLLDVRLPHFAVTGASIKAALEAIIEALDPNPAARLATGVTIATLNAGPAPLPALRNNITVSLDRARMLDVLNAIAAASGDMSWTVRYTSAPATYDTAQIVFSAGGTQAIAESPAALRRAANIVAPDRLRLSGAQISDLLVSYARAVPIRAGVELLPGPPLLASDPLPVKTIDVPRAAAEGIAEITAVDPRYEWTQSEGLFHITPKTGDAETRALLERPVPAFSATNEPLAQVFDRIVWLLGAQPSGAAAMLPAGGREMAPLTMTAPAGSMRALLDALSRAHGSVSWSVGRRTIDSSTIQFVLFGDRLRLARDFLGDAISATSRRPDPPVMGASIASSADAVAVLDRRVPAFHASGEPLAQVLDRIIWAAGIQPGGGGRAYAPAGPERAPVTLDRGQVTIRELLDGLCRAQGTLSWDLRQVAPGSEIVDLVLTSSEGWRLSRRILVPVRR